MTSDGMRVLERGVYRGPHLYSRFPMVRIQLALGELERFPTSRLPGVADRLLVLLPGLAGHGCSHGRPGGLLERMAEGTWLGHVIEHVALELQALAGARAARGKTRSVKGQPGVYNIMFAYDDEAAGLIAGRCAVALVDSLLPDGLRGVEGLDRIAPGSWGVEDGVEAAVAVIAAARRSAAYGPTTASLIAAARRRRIPVERLNSQSLVQLGWGSRQRRIRASVTDRTGLIAAESAGNKAEAKLLLQGVGIPVARGSIVASAEAALAASRGLKAPFVLKPLDGNHGRGVTTGLNSEADLRRGFAEAARHGRRILLEEQLPGRDYRVLVVAGEVVAVAERAPPHVIGDGRATVQELVDAVNADPRRGAGHENLLTRIAIDDSAEALLASQGLRLDAVPSAGRVILLRTTANLSAGGTAIDRTDDIHPDNVAIARRAALAVGLDVAGIDLMAPDIGRSVRDTGGGIVEVNAAPGLRMHLQPSEGQGRDVARPIIDMLYPPGSRARIPILAITGTNGKSTVGRMVAHIFAEQGKTVGLTNTSGVYVGVERVSKADASGPRSARMVLRDPTVDVAVLECARGGILREGLAFDRCDVGAVLNVQPDHIGLKGVMSLSDLAAVKSVVVENVSRRGVSVLNADDPLTVRMARRARGRICWFSMRGGCDAPSLLLDHVATGGLAVTFEPGSGEIALHEHGDRRRVCRSDAIPATLGGHALFNVQNAVAAAAMAYAAGAEIPQIARALATFASSFEQNPGRLNLHEADGVRTILDYAHNPAALRALGRMVAAIRTPGRRCIASLSIPGDRRDAEIREMGAIAAEYFDELVFRETPDNRGRPRGAVVRLMHEGAVSAGFDPARVRLVEEESAAAKAALDLARSGDLVVITPTAVDAVWGLIREHRIQTGQERDVDVRSAERPAFQAILEPPHG